MTPFQALPPAPSDPTLRECGEPLADLSEFPFVPAPVYFWRGWSSSPRLLLRSGMAGRLLSAQREFLEPRGWRWIVFDAWRSRAVQRRIWDAHAGELLAAEPGLAPAELRARVSRFVADPSDPSCAPAHCTGGAVDLGIWDSRAGAPVGLGSGFDEFVEAARPGHFEAPHLRSHPAAAARRVMRGALLSQGMVQDPSEYFHVDFGSEKWARASRAPHAIYGEVAGPWTELGPSAVDGAVSEPMAYDPTPLLMLAGAEFDRVAALVERDVAGAPARR